MLSMNYAKEEPPVEVQVWETHGPLEGTGARLPSLTLNQKVMESH